MRCRYYSSNSIDWVYTFGVIGYIVKIWHTQVPLANKLFGALIWPIVLGAWAAHQMWPK